MARKFYAVSLIYRDEAKLLNINNYSSAVHVFNTEEERDDWVYERIEIRAWAKASDPVVRRAKARFKKTGIQDDEWGMPYIIHEGDKN